MQTFTELLPLDQQEIRWHETLAVLGLESGPISPGFGGDIKIVNSPCGAILARIRGNVPTLRRTSTRGNSASSVLSVLHSDGIGTFSDGVTFAAGDISLCDQASGWAMSFQQECCLLLLEIPRARLLARLGRTRLQRIMIMPQTVSAHSARLIMRTLLDEFDKLDGADLITPKIAVMELIVDALQSGAEKYNDDSITQVQSAHFKRVTAMIEARLTQSDLSLSLVARQEALSERYLQKLFALHDTTFSHYLRTRRLDRARLDLLAENLQAKPVGQIAFTWGFRDQGHFSRSFRKEFGMSPRAYRIAGRRATTAVTLVRGRPVGAVEASTIIDNLAADEAAGTKPAGLKPLKSELPANDEPFHVAANRDTVHWGYLSNRIPPVLHVSPGDRVRIETLTQHASDDHERMIKDDPGAESVFLWTREQKNVNRRGAGPLDASIFGRGAGEGFGVHILTGPIHIDGAEPGDILEVQILDIEPRPSANRKFRGSSFASNASTWWGYQYSDFIDPSDPREIVTIFEIEPDAQWAQAIYSYRWVAQTDPFGVRHEIIDYPGVPVDRSIIKKRTGILQDIRIPIRAHFGCMAVAPGEEGMVDSVPPGKFGGNLDNWRAGKGSTLYLPVSTRGALFSIGDGHLAQGDGEVSGTALECSLTGLFRFDLHKRDALKKPFLRGLAGPLIEAGGEFVLHGFSYPDYLQDLGRDAQAEVYQKSSLNRALRSAFRATRKFLMDWRGLTEDEVTTLMSVAVDFGITQVADGNWGVHAIIRRDMFTS